MSVSAAQSSAFFAEVGERGELFAVRDDRGFPAPEIGPGVRAMPFWSRESRARRVIERVPAYRGFAPVRLSLEEFRGTWIPGLASDGLQVGLNWSGTRATGYDFTPAEVLARLDASSADGAS